MNHSALDPGGSQAAAIQRLFHVMLPIAVGVYLAVIAMLAWIAWRRKQRGGANASSDSGALGAVASALGATTTILLGVLLYNNSVAHALMPGHLARPLTIKVTGHQWWWEVEYQDTVAQQHAMLANEIHVPTGRPIVIDLFSHDVIHSFWVPGVGGKKDLIPGHHTSMVFEADRAGVYRGQCAEFCGAEHAKMAIVVVAQPEPEFEAWREGQRAPAATPIEAQAVRGQQLFEAGNCSTCHTVSGTRAAGRVGPDLTHFAGRRTIAAGTMENTAGNLAAWLADPQLIKPGVQMPVTALAPADLQALVAYLTTLR